MRMFKIIFTVAQIIFVITLALAIFTDKRKDSRSRSLYVTALILAILSIGSTIGMWL